MNITENPQVVNRQQEEEFDYKKAIYLMLRQWRWFAFFGVLGLLGAFAYNKMTKPSYTVSTSILIPEKSSGINMKDLFQGSIDGTKNNIYNQIEIINSYYTINNVLLNLNWRTSWYAKDIFIWKEIYKQEPFDVQETPDFINTKGLPIYITPTSGNNYTISANGKIRQNDILTDVKFEGTGTFGQPFVNKYFNFTLLKKVGNDKAPNGDFYFVFNDLKDATKLYQRRLKVILKDKKSDIIECSIQGEHPVKESEFLNELTKVYTEGKMSFQNEAQRRSLEFINNQLSGITDSLNTAGTKFSEFRSRNSIIDLGAEGTMVMNNLREIETDKAKSQMQLDYFENLLKYLNSNSDPKQIISPSVVGIDDASLNSLVLKLGDLLNRRQVLSFSAKENNPTLILIDKELNQIRNQLTENLTNLIDNATRNIKSQKERHDRISLQLNRLPQKEQQMVNIQRQFNLTNEIYTFLLQKRAETNISLASSLPDVQIVDMARPEVARKVGLDSKVILLLGLLIGLLIPMLYIGIFNLFNDRIRSQKDLEKHTSIPILANITHCPSKNDLSIFENPKSSLAESYRALRTNLKFVLNGENEKVISILSTNPNEGKSFSAVNLGTILAMNDKKVLIIGADMRKPRLHKIFDLPNERGLSTYLIGKDSIDSIIQKTKIDNLSFLPGGPIPPNPAEILGKPEFKLLLDTLRPRYDFLIIDNAPTGLVTDGNIVSQWSDLNIFILRYNVSHKHQIEMINQYVEKKTIKNVAIVVNDIKTNSFGNSYYKYYQYESYQDNYYSSENEKS